MNCVIDLWRPHHGVRLLGQSEVGSAVELSCPREECDRGGCRGKGTDCVLVNPQVDRVRAVQDEHSSSRTCCCASGSAHKGRKLRDSVRLFTSFPQWI